MSNTPPGYCQYRWELVGNNFEEIESFSDSLKSSKDKNEKSLCKYLSENLIEPLLKKRKDQEALQKRLQRNSGLDSKNIISQPRQRRCKFGNYKFEEYDQMSDPGSDQEGSRRSTRRGSAVKDSKDKTIEAPSLLLGTRSRRKGVQVTSHTDDVIKNDGEGHSDDYASMNESDSEESKPFGMDDDDDDGNDSEEASMKALKHLQTDIKEQQYQQSSSTTTVNNKSQSPPPPSYNSSASSPDHSVIITE
eukprot:TRINITY_DN3418_c0_g1_i1.p1 TRINITY_DN3418_c0_g1~~TRINITY_DN3418_c0_g1_i1.p1  ORF type:complete len:248 (-),score=76.29 TRINITY_DN3418_c0_g1_i1:26-769(-)